MRLRALIQKLGLAILLAGAPLLAQSQGGDDKAQKTDANIARVTAALLQQTHYSHHPFDEEMAGKFLDRYLDALDRLHLYFLQSDLNDFAPYRTNLNLLTVRGDNSPSSTIFDRFMVRAEQRLQYVTNLLATEKFDFTGNDRYVVDRHQLPAPKDLNEAKQLWREELRFEYLQEKLGAPDIKFTGPASTDASGAARIQLTKEKSRTPGFDVLPGKFYDQAGHQIGTVTIESDTNAVVIVPKDSTESLKKLERKMYSESGAELGKLSIRWQTNDVAATGTNSSPSATATNATVAQFTGAIQLNQKNMSEVVKTLTNRYSRLVKNYKELDRDDVFEIYMTALAHAYDPHSDYMGHAQQENFAIMMKLSLFGIGAVLQSEDGYCKIAELTPEGPASKSGKLKPGDRIVAVAQGDKEAVDVVGMKLTKVVEQIRGPKGTQVRLTVLPAGTSDNSARHIVSIVRDEIKLTDQAAKAKIFDVPSAGGTITRLGVIDLSGFYDNTTADVEKLLERLKKEHVAGIVLDLRHNGGGYLEEAIKLTGLFITKGPVVQTKDPNGEIVTDSDPDPAVQWDGPLIVLTSRFSASASEILAGALQDYGRALIVGDRATFGKGTVQSMQKLVPFFDMKKLQYAFDPGSLKLTIRKFYRAGGSSTQLKGVVSDIELPSILNYADVGESSMENALPWDEVPSADPQQLNRVKPYLYELQKRSAQRVEQDRDFAYIQEDIAEYKKALADKSVSLNEAERIAEKKKNESRLDVRKKERLSRPKADEKVYELTQKNVDLPELQAPVVKTNDLAKLQSDLLELSDELPTADAKAPDATLEETKHILQDYIGLMNKAPNLLAKEPAGGAPANAAARNKTVNTGATVTP